MSFVKSTSHVPVSIALAFLAIPLKGHCQTSGERNSQTRDTVETNASVLEIEEEKAGTAKPDLTLIPVPVVNPTIGTGIAGAAILNFGPAAARSTIVGGGGVTEEGNWLAGVGADVRLLNDRLRLRAMAGGGNLELKYYGSDPGSSLADDPVAYTRSGWFIQINPEIRLVSRLYGGFVGQFFDSRITVKSPTEALAQTAIPFQYTAIGPILEYDSRDTKWWPTSGFHATAKRLSYNLDSSAFTEEYGSHFKRFDISGATYFAVREDMVLAVKARTAGASADTPFFLKPSISFRGFKSGERQDDFVLEGQGELRWMFSRKLGVVGFTGIGATGADPGSLGRLAWGAGGGVRYRISQADRSNIGLDVATGGGDWSIYLSLGEAF